MAEDSQRRGGHGSFQGTAPKVDLREVVSERPAPLLVASKPFCQLLNINVCSEGNLGGIEEAELGEEPTKRGVGRGQMKTAPPLPNQPG